jgi:hypothetical protein
MQTSDYLLYKQKEAYWLDLSKFAFLLNGIIGIFGEEGKDITELIGEAPTYGEEDERELTENDIQWIEWAKKNGYEYKITNTGVKINKG